MSDLEHIIIEEISPDVLGEAIGCDVPRFEYPSFQDGVHEMIEDEKYLIQDLRNNYKTLEEWERAVGYIVIFRADDGSNYVINGLHRSAIAVEQHIPLNAFVVHDDDSLKELYDLLDGRKKHPKFKEDHMIWDYKGDQTYFHKFEDKYANGLRPESFEKAQKWVRSFEESTIAEYLDLLIDHYG